MATTVTLEKAHYVRTLYDRRRSSWEPLPHQHPPDTDWFFWLLEAGRGAGKTAAAAHFVAEHLNGPPCISAALPHRVGLIAPTLGDGIESAALNDQALARLEPGARLRSHGGGTRVDWPNGSQVRIFGTQNTEDVERLRAGGNRCLYWLEELATWRRLKEAWDLMMFGLRLGPNPRLIGTTTPKARPDYLKYRDTADIIVGATTLDNPFLNEGQKKRLLEMYEGTSIGEQELFGKVIEEAEGALWTVELIDQHRLDEPGTLGRGVVAVDPPGGATEAGIVTATLIPHCACGRPRLPHFAVLDDRSAKLSPDGWGSRAVSAYHEFDLDRVVGESNFGGDMVEAIIRQTDRDVSYKQVRASRGKRIRAEPVKALYEQGRVHHVGLFPELEAEMVQWIPDESVWSPNRMDALVWAITDLAGSKMIPDVNWASKAAV